MSYAVPVDHVSEPRGRIAAIDFTKGVLVLLMVLYHTLNYLEYGSIPHEYMAFLPPSFILLAGLLAAEVNAGRKLTSDRRSRLFVRALKILLVFTGLNVAARVVWSSTDYGMELALREFFRGWRDVYLTGNNQRVAFDVLVPIAYTLALAALALPVHSPKSHFMAAVTLLTF